MNLASQVFVLPSYLIEILYTYDNKQFTLCSLHEWTSSDDVIPSRQSLTNFRSAS